MSISVRQSFGLLRGVRALAEIRRHPLPVGPIPYVSGGPPVPIGRSLRILCWNLQFCAGRGRCFFYDGGQAVDAEPGEVAATLAGVIDTIRRWDPDLVLLQEVDRGSRRTQYVDQHAKLAAALAYPSHVSAPYHRMAYVPHPAWHHLGPIDMHLSVFSKFKLEGAVRHALPLLDEPWLRRQFNLRRCVLEVQLPTVSGAPLRVFDTHLSAFSFGDGTLDRQVAIVDRLVRGAGPRWLLGGDFNALPPDDDPTRLGGTEALQYPEPRSPMSPLLRAHAASAAGLVAAERTYLPFGAWEADRTLDWLLRGAGVTPEAYRVDHDARALSDHLPLVWDVRL